MFYLPKTLCVFNRKIKVKYSTLKQLKIENYELQIDILCKDDSVNSIFSIIDQML